MSTENVANVVARYRNNEPELTAPIQNNEDNQVVAEVGQASRSENISRPNGNSIQLASKQYNNIIQFQEPSTSKNISVKTEIRINILSDKDSDLSNESQAQMSLSLYKGVNNKEEYEEESFHTMDMCLKDKNINTNPTVSFNDRIKNLRGEAPPAYQPSHPPPAYSAVQGQPPPQMVYNQAQPVIIVTERGQRIYDAQRSSTYRRNDPDTFSSSSLIFDRAIRNKFVQKVYAILAIQLLFSFGFVMLCLFHKKTNKFVRSSFVTFICFFVFWLVLYIALMCYKACRRIFPLNFILLVLFTICQSYIMGTGSAFYSTKVVLITLGATAGICLVVSFIACQNWFDITKWGFILSIAGIVVMVFGLIVMIVSFVTGRGILNLVYAGLVTGLFTVYLLYDTQCILGGGRVAISPEEYIFGVLTLYVDIFLIFMYMLQLVNACQ